MFSQGTVTVITAAIGHHNLSKCAASVQYQTHAKTDHWIVVDGPEHEANVRNRLPPTLKKRPTVLTLPHSTGKNNWNGHRIYAASSFLINSEFIAFLDEDNWYDPDHIGSLMSSIESSKAAWAFSLRKIVDIDGNVVVLDNCESLGGFHHAVNSPQNFLVDTSGYLLRREVAVAHAPIWYSPTRAPDVRMEPDGALCRALLKSHPKFASNRRHTLNYSVGNRPDSVQAGFFLHGNEVMRQKYPGGLPWET
jgi:hypothetical protein